jgi:tRNA modification GTPase
MGANGRSAEIRGDTIAAVATAPGRGALAVVRMSGADAPRIAARTCTPWPVQAREATRVRIHEPDVPDSTIDEAIVTWFAAPRSATGEEVVEFSVHGGRRVSTLVLAALVSAGARPALAGEFTERAVRNGKLDLLQAEAIADLIDARSQASHRAALRQLSGALSSRLHALRESLLDVEALVAYEIDFPEEDDGPQPRARASSSARTVVASLDALLATMPRAELGREGVTVVLAGAPNAGKSSLFNALVGDPRAIVSEIPGTTRDAIEVLVDDDPWPLRLVDTAGLREGADALERLGVGVSEHRLAGAHLVLACAADDGELATTCARIAALSPARRIAVRTKADLLQAAWPAPNGLTADASVAVSAVTGDGLDALREAIRHSLRAIVPDPVEELPVITRARHAHALELARAETKLFIAAWEEATLPAPVVATHLRAAVHAVDELVGAIDVDEVMERVFRDFCIGK